MKIAMTGFLAVLALIFCCSTAVLAADESDIVQQRNQVREMAREGLSALYEAQPGARYAIEHAAGYGVFSVMGVKIFFAGGTTGKGLVHDNRTTATLHENGPGPGRSRLRGREGPDHLGIRDS